MLQRDIRVISGHAFMYSLLTSQYPFTDSGMHLNQGKFRKNGGCGYILKPNSLRDRGKDE